MLGQGLVSGWRSTVQTGLGSGLGQGLHCGGGRIPGWGSPLSSMGLWDRVRACSTQLPFSPNTQASFWTKSLQAGEEGFVCPRPWASPSPPPARLAGTAKDRAPKVGSSSGSATELATALEHKGSCAETKPSFGPSSQRSPPCLVVGGACWEGPAGEGPGAGVGGLGLSPA